MGLGEFAAIGAALAWAVGFLIIKPVSIKFSPVSINSIVLGVAWIILVAITAPSGKLGGLTSIGWHSMIYVIGSAVVGVGAGAILEIKAMSLADISLVYPINFSLYFLSASALAAIFFGEAITSYTVLGAVSIIVGITLLSSPAKAKGGSTLKSDRTKGIIFTSISGLCWGGATILCKLALYAVDPLVLNVIRLPFVILPLVIVTLIRNGVSEYKRYTPKDLIQAGTSGFFAHTVGTVLFLVAVSLIGAIKASILTSISPLFIAPLSVIFLKEKLTKRAILGIIICTLGIPLTTL